MQSAGRLRWSNCASSRAPSPAAFAYCPGSATRSSLLLRIVKRLLPAKRQRLPHSPAWLRLLYSLNVSFYHFNLDVLCLAVIYLVPTTVRYLDGPSSNNSLPCIVQSVAKRSTSCCDCDRINFRGSLSCFPFSLLSQKSEARR